MESSHLFPTSGAQPHPQLSFTERALGVPSFDSTPGTLPTYTCPNHDCRQAIPDVYDHLSAAGSPCAAWALSLISFIESGGDGAGHGTRMSFKCDRYQY